MDAFSQYILLQRSVISENYQVFVTFLGMADSQNMLVDLQYNLLKITENCIEELALQKIKSKLNRILS